MTAPTRRPAKLRVRVLRAGLDRLCRYGSRLPGLCAPRSPSKQAAKALGMDRSEWMRLTLERRCETCLEWQTSGLVRCTDDSYRNGWGSNPRGIRVGPRKPCHSPMCGYKPPALPLSHRSTFERGGHPCPARYLLASIGLHPFRLPPPWRWPRTVATVGKFLLVTAIVVSSIGERNYAHTAPYGAI